MEEQEFILDHLAKIQAGYDNDDKVRCFFSKDFSVPVLFGEVRKNCPKCDQKLRCYDYNVRKAWDLSEGEVPEER